jgi:hypothetical protein
MVSRLSLSCSLVSLLFLGLATPGMASRFDPAKPEKYPDAINPLPELLISPIFVETGVNTLLVMGICASYNPAIHLPR